MPPLASTFSLSHVVGWRQIIVPAQLALRIRISCGDAFAIGPGKADLLEVIDREGSISGAGRAIGMSYRKAWLLTDEMNRCFVEPVVESTTGGIERGTRLTPFGRAVLSSFREMEARSLEAARGSAFERLQQMIRNEPRPADD